PFSRKLDAEDGWEMRLLGLGQIGADGRPPVHCHVKWGTSGKHKVGEAFKIFRKSGVVNRTNVISHYEHNHASKMPAEFYSSLSAEISLLAELHVAGVSCYSADDVETARQIVYDA